ncbi:lysosomal acid glucosylceramidase-like [Battus philenor]|uniref:lysosomal acid glucosylceramidase-like n=1 Tax=Battus philenor TaxID=42288 RepID=UPI0035CEB7B0
MYKYRTILIIIAVLFISKSIESKRISSQKPCAAKSIPGQSVVCVCNTTYCDEVMREFPRKKHYVAYTSSKAGSRFKKSHGRFNSPTYPDDSCVETLYVNPKKKHQKIKGFGGAITDATGINLKSLPAKMQQYMIDSYFSSRGIEYNMMRVPIGGSDFSTHRYYYNELPIDDTELTNYTLTREDYQYKIPVIKACEKAATAPVYVLGSVWSPPVWMIDHFKAGGLNRLNPKYMQTYALYFLRFLEQYMENGIKLWGITTTNEPLDGVLPLGKFQHLGWSTKSMGEWIKNNLGPTIRNSKFNDTMILAVDDQRFSVPMWFNILIEQVPEAEKYIDGIGVHFYFDQITPPMLLKEAIKDHPDKFIISTEACEGSSSPKGEKVILGSWKRAQRYIVDILEDLLNDVAGWIDWNMCLDMQGGPNWAKNFVDSPIIVDAKKKEFYKQPMFFAMGHVSKFVKRDSYRIEMTNVTVCPVPENGDYESSENIYESNTDTNPPAYDSAAFVTPDNTIVIVIHNQGSEKTVVVKMGDKEAVVQLEASSITTVEFLNDENFFECK